MKGVKGQDATTADHTRLITDSYRAANRLLHTVGFGKGGYQWAPAAVGAIMMTRASRSIPIQSVLDYGCGQGTLQWVLVDLLQQHGLAGQVSVQGYDPCVPNSVVNQMPDPADLVMCTDVLEHIEPDLIGNVLKHLASLTQIMGIFSIAMNKSAQVLSDGRNAHVLIKPKEWWDDMLRQYFKDFDFTTLPINKPGEHLAYIVTKQQDHTPRKQKEPLTKP